MHNLNFGNMSKQLPGSLAPYQDIYDTIDAGAFRNMSDGSKSAFWNFIAAERANQHELDMWNMQNAYNTPEEQMKRMIQAGVNPAAAYQSISSGNASSMPGTHKPTYAFNNQEQKMQKITTAINGVSQVISSIGELVNIASGIQGMGINYQNNYVTQLRNAVLREDPEIFSSDPNFNNGANVRLGENFYTKPGYAVLFPELVGAGKLNQSYGVFEMNKNNSYWLNQIRSKNLNADSYMESLIKDLTSGNWSSAWQNAIRLIMINLFRRY